MLIAIPSKGRAGKVPSWKYMPQGVVFVPELEVEAYQRTGIDRVVGIPNDVRGITATRNWILDNTSEDWVVFVDDDLKKAGWLQVYDEYMQVQKMSPEAMIAEWTKLFEVAEDMALPVWGVSTISAPRAVYPYRPIIFRTYVTASCMGMRNSTGLRFDPSFKVKEDYELCLRVLRDYGGVVGARYLFWENSHWRDEGGCKDYRTREMEDDAITRLQKLYPGIVRRAPNSDSEFTIALDL